MASKLDENFPRCSAEHWLARNYVEVQTQSATLQSIDEQITAGNSLLEKNHGEAQTQSATLQSIDTNIDSQKVILQNIGEDVARAIYDGLDERINAAVENLCDRLEKKLLPQTDKICAAIDKLGKGGTDKIGDIFAGKVGSQMDRFSAALDRFSDNIDKKLEAANEISKIMNEQMLNTLKTLDETLNIVDAHNEATKKTFAQVQTLLNETKTFLNNMDTASISLNKAADPVKQSTQQLTRNLTETAAQLKTLATANQTTRDNLAALSTRLATFVQNFNGIADELERSTGIIGKSLDNYNVKTNAGLNDKLEKFDKSMAGAVGHLQELVTDLSEELEKFNRNRR